MQSIQLSSPFVDTSDIRLSHIRHGDSLDCTLTTESKGPTVMTVMWNLTAMTKALVVVRICVLKHMRNFGPDDCQIRASMILLFPSD